MCTRMSLDTSPPTSAPSTTTFSPDPNAMPGGVSTGSVPPTNGTSRYSSNIILGPNDVIVSERQIGNTSWPSGLVLDFKQENWLEWSRHLTLVADQIHVSDYLDGTLPCPNPSLFPNAYKVWMAND